MKNKLPFQLLLFVLATFTSLQVFGQLSGYYQEDFEGSFPPEDWQTINVLDPSYYWQHSPYTVYSGDFSVYNGSAIGQGEDWLILPQFSVAASDSFSFWFTAESLGFTDSTMILVSTTDDDLSSFTNVIAVLSDGVNYPTVANLYQYYAYSLSALAGQDIYLAFKNRNYGGDGVYVDLVSIGTLLGTSVTQIAQDNFNLSVYLFPNPATNNLNAKFSGYEGNVTVQVFDLFGKIIFTSITNSEDQFKMDVHELASGMYFLCATDEQGHTTSSKWMKE